MGFFADNRGSYTLRSTTDSTGPHLLSANSDENHTGLELWAQGQRSHHCVCGTGKNTADSSHNKHTKVKWIGVTTLNDLPEGNYYLLENSYYYTGSPWTLRATATSASTATPTPPEFMTMAPVSQ